MGRCKKYINTQLGARGYGTPSNTARATIGSWVCHPEEGVENTKERKDGWSVKKYFSIKEKIKRESAHTDGAVWDVEAAFLLPAYLNSWLAHVSVCLWVYVCAQDICRLESHVLHIPTCPALTALRNGMGKSSAYNTGPGKLEAQRLTGIHKTLVIILYLRNNKQFSFLIRVRARY